MDEGKIFADYHELLSVIKEHKKKGHRIVLTNGCFDLLHVGHIRCLKGAKEEGDTLGGIFEVVARGVPVGLGSHVSWDRKLDGRLGQAVLSIHAVKGVEVGTAFEGAFRHGSQVHGAIVSAPERPRTGGLGRASNRAGGLEGGVTTGEPLLVRGAMKPISTLRKPLASVDLRDGSPAQAAVERSDVCAVPAAAVVAEAMVALVLADAFLEKFGGDSMTELARNFESYLAHLQSRASARLPPPWRTHVSWLHCHRLLTQAPGELDHPRR